MGRNIDEIKEEGMDIAEKLGNGVRYAGPQMMDGKLIYHLFNDDAVTDGSFAANAALPRVCSGAARRARQERQLSSALGQVGHLCHALRAIPEGR